jgi:hypothetical protein
MKDALKAIGAGVGVVVLLWGVTYHDLVYTAFFGPKFENVRRNTFEQSKSFRDGAVQELQNMQFEYIKADPAHKKALADVIRHRAVEIPSNAMPSNLQSFISNLPQ